MARTPRELEGEVGIGPGPSVIEEETVVPRTLLQPATMVQPQSRAEATKSTTRGLRLWRYGAAAGSLLMLGLMIGGLWDRFHQPTEEAQFQSEEEQRVVDQPPPQLATTAPEVQSPVNKKKAEPVPQTSVTPEQGRERHEEAAQAHQQEKLPQQQAKVELPQAFTSPPGGHQGDGSTGGDIQKVDFHNFSYPLSSSDVRLLNTQAVRVRDGKYDNGKQDNDWQAFGVGKIVYGDLTGDGHEEAVILTTTEWVGANPAGSISKGFYVYTMKDGNPSILTTPDSIDYWRDYSLWDYAGVKKRNKMLVL